MVKLNSLIKSAVIFFLVFFSINSIAVDFPTSPNPFRYVNDYTHTLSANESQYLENKLTAYSKETSSQIAVVIIPTTGEYEIAQYAFELGDKWGIGRKTLNNGVLMLIAKNDRKVFIATGQGLEGVLPDALLSQIIRNVITPQFKQNLYAQGISNGLDYIISASKGEFEAYQEPESPYEKYIFFFMALIFIAFVIFGEIQWRKDDVYISPSNRTINDTLRRQSSLSRRRGNIVGMGGSFGRNNDGGFGGGSSGGFGGGGFGGGGAGGSW